MFDIRLVCLDFDGTIMAYEEATSYFHPVAVDLLNRLEGAGVAWCTNSGRSFEDQVQIIERSVARGLLHRPAAILCSEAFVYERQEDGGYKPLEPWNGAARSLLRTLHAAVQQAVDPRVVDWAERYAPEVRVGAEYTVFCVEDVEDRAARFAEEVREAVAGISGAVVTRNGGWVGVLPDRLGKGNVLRAYRERAGWTAQQVLAVGDHLNDINMLEGGAARHVGCPANAMPEVVQVVRACKGYVARGAGPEGTAEVIRHFVGVAGG